jgi:hypothetical protein
LAIHKFLPFCFVFSFCSWTRNTRCRPSTMTDSSSGKGKRNQNPPKEFRASFYCIIMTSKKKRVLLLCITHTQFGRRCYCGRENVWALEGAHSNLSKKRTRKHLEQKVKLRVRFCWVVSRNVVCCPGEEESDVIFSSEKFLFF